MIKHIILDMRQVLVSYVGDPVCQEYVEDEQKRKEVNTLAFVSLEWILLDISVMSEEETPKEMQDRLDTEHKRNVAAWCFWHWHEYSIGPREEMEQVVRWLKPMGYGVYLCSNAPVRLLTCYKEVIPAIGRLGGILFSADVQCLKSQKEMCQHLFDRPRLKPEECFFISDLSLNMERVRKCGMDGRCFEDGGAGKLKEVLGSLDRQQLHFNGKQQEV